MKFTVKSILTLLSTLTAAERRIALADRLQTRGLIPIWRYYAACAHRNEVRARIEALLHDACWGRHDNGRVFVQSCSQWPSPAAGRTITINIDGLPALSGRCYEYQDRSSGRWRPGVANLHVHDTGTERMAREERRAAARAHEAAQAAARTRIAADLRCGRVPRGVEAIDGQRGGFLVVGERSKTTWRGTLASWAGRDSRETTAPGLTLAIGGVLRSAGIDPGEHPFATWTEHLADLRSHELEVPIRARQLPPRVRHLRAAEIRA